MTEKLAELGHPNTKMCQIPTSNGLGNLLTIQFKQNASSDADEQQTIAILKIIAPALNGSSQRYVGFEATQNWETCQTRNPEIAFWRDYDDNWRYITKSPRNYLSRMEKELDPGLRGTPAEAYVLFSLAHVEQRLDRIPASVERFEAAWDILSRTDDPNGISAFVLAPLIYHHFDDEGDEKKGQSYLNAYALIAEDSTTTGGSFVPLIKVAPVYPVDAFRRGQEGYVLLEFTVDAEGKVQDPVVIEQYPTDIFGAAAMEAALAFRYIPKVVDGQPVTTTGVRNKITFEITD